MFLAEFASKYQVPFFEVDLSSIHSIEFLNSLCIIRKKDPISNRLGKRIIVGKNELITTGIIRMNETSIHDSEVELSNDSDLEIWKLIKRNEVASNVIEANSKEIARLNNEKKRLANECNNLLAANTELQQALSSAKIETNNLIAVNIELQQALSSAEIEIVDYHNSKIWKITRPFRWINKKIRGSNG
jgi:hypothetical protein